MIRLQGSLRKFIIHTGSIPGPAAGFLPGWVFQERAPKTEQQSWYPSALEGNVLITLSCPTSVSLKGGTTQGHIHQAAGITRLPLKAFCLNLGSWKGKLQCRTLDRRAFLWRWGAAQRMFHPQMHKQQTRRNKQGDYIEVSQEQQPFLQSCSSNGRHAYSFPFSLRK